MSFLKNLFKNNANKTIVNEPIKITRGNIGSLEKFDRLLKEGKVKFDSTGQLRYLHGAPVGVLTQTGTDKNGIAIYQESADEWFDPESQKAKEFMWP